MSRTSHSNAAPGRIATHIGPRCPYKYGILDLAQDANSTVFVAQHSAFAAAPATSDASTLGVSGTGLHNSTAQPASLAAGASTQQDEDDEATVIVRRAASAPVMRPAAQAGPASAAQKLGLTALPGPVHADEHSAAAAQVRVILSFLPVEQYILFSSVMGAALRSAATFERAVHSHNNFAAGRRGGIPGDRRSAACTAGRSGCHTTAVKANHLQVIIWLTCQCVARFA